MGYPQGARGTDRLMLRRLWATLLLFTTAAAHVAVALVWVGAFGPLSKVRGTRGLEDVSCEEARSFQPPAVVECRRFRGYTWASLVVQVTFGHDHDPAFVNSLASTNPFSSA